MKSALFPALLIVLTTAVPGATIIKEKLAPSVSKVAPDHPAMPAIKAFNNGQNIEALRLAEPLADLGNAEALLIMGLSYEKGLGVEASPEKAIGFYRKAIEADNKQASYQLAPMLVSTGKAEAREEARKTLENIAHSDNGTASRMLGDGELQGWFGGEPNFDKIRSYWTRSAAEGDVAAMVSLGRLLDGELGFPDKREPAAALKQFLKAASLDDPVAMVAAGTRMLNGDESIRDEEQGREWLNKAVAAEQYDAYLALGIYEQTVKENKEAALGYFRNGAEKGEPGCMLQVGLFLLEGAGGAEKNSKTALEWFKKSGESGNPFGHLQAARLLLEEDEPSKPLESYKHLIAAANAGIPLAQNEVGMLYHSGKLGAPDATAAAGWFSRASASGFTQASANLAALYERGLGVPQNFSEAGRLYTMAANLGNRQAIAALGRLHAKGLGTDLNLPKAWAMFTLAVELGDETSKAPLEELSSQLTDAQVDEGRQLLAGFKGQAKDAASDE